jgi:hypothetical protein
VASEDEELPEQPIRKGKRGTYYYETNRRKKNREIHEGVEKPYKVDSDGVYYYNTDTSSKKEVPAGVEQPIDQDSSGGYYYSKKKKKKKRKNTYGGQPTTVNEDGSYFYDLESHDVDNVFSLRFGLASPPNFKTSNPDVDYEDVYGSDSKILISLEYDWKLTKQFFVKFASGFTSMQGQGRFASGGNGGATPQESFQFFVFPNTFTAVYKFQLYDLQYLTPYVEAGPGYFTFIESRSDGNLFDFNGETTKLGGAFVGAAAAGLLISINKFSQGNSFLADYGASQAWVDLQFKQIFGLDSRKDFTSNMITAGIAIGF